RAGPAVAQADGVIGAGLFGIDSDEAFFEGEAAGLAAGVAADVGRATVGAGAEELLAQAGGVVLALLIARGRGRGLGEDLASVGAFVLDACGVHVGLVGREGGEAGGGAAGGEQDRGVV